MHPVGAAPKSQANSQNRAEGPVMMMIVKGGRGEAEILKPTWCCRAPRPDSARLSPQDVRRGEAEPSGRTQQG